MKIPWRLRFSLGAIAVAAIKFLVIRFNLRTRALLAAVQAKDDAAVRRLLENDPNVITALALPPRVRSPRPAPSAGRNRPRSTRLRRIQLVGR